MDFWVHTFVTLAVGLVVSIVTARLTVRLALRRFYSEKWWERRSEAYSALMESLHHVREHAATYFEYEIKAQKYPDALGLPAEGELRLKSSLEQAIGELRKQRDIGSFIIDDAAVAVLNKLFGELDQAVEAGRQESYLNYLDYRVAAIDRALKDMRETARKALSLT